MVVVLLLVVVAVVVVVFLLLAVDVVRDCPLGLFPTSLEVRFNVED